MPNTRSSTALRLLTLGGLGVVAITASSSGQIVHPNQIKGVVEFTNTNPDVLQILTDQKRPPGARQGMVNLDLSASSLPPQSPTLTHTTVVDPATYVSTPYEITVETGPPGSGIAYELTAEAPVAGVLMLHGMSDSPYTLRALAETLAEQGYWVIGLRLPGHGTAPSGVRYTSAEDMSAAVRLAMEHLGTKLGDRPVHIVG